MARKGGKNSNEYSALRIPDETRRAVAAIVCVLLGLFLTLSAFNAAGIAGSDTYALINSLLGVGYFVLPLLCFVMAWVAIREEGTPFTLLKSTTGGVFVLAALGFVALLSGHGGLLGNLIATPAVHYFNLYAAGVFLGGVALIALFILLEGRLSPAPFMAAGRWFIALLPRRAPEASVLSGLPLEAEATVTQEQEEEGYEELDEPVSPPPRATREAQRPDTLKALLGHYTPPPLSLLERDKGRPGVGDIKGNANIIKRTLANFGIVVELDEISIGPTVTRYAIKPAEGVRLQKIVSLQTNLELALAAHPVRIEAPIPGKSLVGIEVPNSAKVTVGLGTLLESPDFAHSGKPLLIALGRDIAGGSVFGNIARMPHVLIAGATGSGKSVTIHAIINSLLYRAGPQQMRFIMIDPKRVELTLYNALPHQLTPVITDPKRAIMALRWAAREMERRYNILEAHHVRDVESYHENVLAPALEGLRKRGALEEGQVAPEAMPYIVIIIDELADIMQTFPRELEAAVVRLAQMSRAVGIHLILSTQRPSVNVITGLIKANIPARIALQVASQIDSRTILDQGGAEKLLGAGDMLYLSGDMQKPVRLQSAFISESEVKKIVGFVAKNNEAGVPVDIGAPPPSASPFSGGSGFGDEEDVDDEVYEAARSAVIEAGKASTSYIQRKLRIGYSRAARIMDMLEERGIIGPQDGAKPREVLTKDSSAGGEEEV